MNDFYMLQQLDQWITGNYGEERFFIEKEYENDMDYDEYEEDYDDE